MNNFINREKELGRLQNLYNSQGAKLAVVYGRRRLGKTSLLKQFASDLDHCYFMANRAGEKLQINAFGNALSASLIEPIFETIDFQDWDQLFSVFERVRQKDKKFVLIIDEFQYLCQVQTAFSSIIQKWWDETWQFENILLILCGSVTSMMYKETLASSAPLYGRSSLQLLLQPLNYQFLPDFLPTVNNEQTLVEFYSISGGVPRYIELLRDYNTFNDAVENLLLDKNSLLFNEGKYLLHEEITVPNTCWSILHALGSGCSKISELGTILSLPANQLTRYIDLLKDLFLIYRETPVLEKNPAKSKKGLYRISDPFVKLWFGCLYPYESFLEFSEKDKIIEKLRNLFNNHIEYCYEELCRHYIKNRMLDFNCIKVGRQWSAKCEFDIVGVNEQNRVTLVGESKWSKKHLGLSILKELKSKISTNNLPIVKDCQFILFSKSGFSEELIKLSQHDEQLILVNSLFKIQN